MYFFKENHGRKKTTNCLPKKQYSLWSYRGSAVSACIKIQYYWINWSKATFWTIIFLQYSGRKKLKRLVTNKKNRWKCARDIQNLWKKKNGREISVETLIIDSLTTIFLVHFCVTPIVLQKLFDRMGDEQQYNIYTDYRIIKALLNRLFKGYKSSVGFKVFDFFRSLYFPG